jgi:hypothetical protein
MTWALTTGTAKSHFPGHPINRLISKKGRFMLQADVSVDGEGS